MTPTGRRSVELCQAGGMAKGVKIFRESATMLAFYPHCVSCSNLYLVTVRNELLKLVLTGHHIWCINCLSQIENYTHVNGANL